MDEVYYDCWLSSPVIKDFMTANNLVNVSQVEQFYVEKTLKNVKDIGYKYMTWQDPVDNGVKVSLNNKSFLKIVIKGIVTFHFRCWFN